LAGAPDLARAAKWYQRAADAGHSEAQLALADLYLEGMGVEQSVDQAQEWYQRAADQGSQRGAEMLAKIQQDADSDSLA
jgi:TPR repeat protein